MELLFWQSVMNSTSAPDYEAYLQKYPDGQFAVLAKARLETLQAKPAPAAAAPPAGPPPAPVIRASDSVEVRPLTKQDFVGQWVLLARCPLQADRLDIKKVDEVNHTDYESWYVNGRLSGSVERSFDKSSPPTHLHISTSWITYQNLDLIDRDNMNWSAVGMTCNFARLGTPSAQDAYDYRNGMGEDHALANALMGAVGSGTLSPSAGVSGQLGAIARAVDSANRQQTAEANGASGGSAAPLSNDEYVPTKACSVLGSCDWDKDGNPPK